MSSILTNNGAMTALQTLKTINKDMSTVQNQISTGKTINSAKDNAATWAISKVMEADVASFKAISDSLSLGESTVAVARNATESVTDLLTEIKTKAVGALESNVDGDKIKTDIESLTEQIKGVIGSAQFNGLNLIDGKITTEFGGDPDATPVVEGTKGIQVMAALDRASDQTVTASTIDVASKDLLSTFEDGGDFATKLADIDFTDRDTVEAFLTEVNTTLDGAIDAAASFGSVENRIEIQNEFVGKLMDSMKSGIGAMVDADMEETSARLQALQVQQQLGVQSLSMANQAPQSLLSLFR